MIRQEEFLVHGGSDLEQLRALTRGAAVAYLNGLVLKIPEDLDLIQPGDVLVLRFDDDDEVVKRLGKLAE